jgi:hypothetical protein
LRKATDADAMNVPGTIAGAFNARTERPHGIGSVQNIFAFQQATDGSFADGKRAQDQGAVRDRFVPRNAGPPLDGATLTGGQRR